MGGKFGFLFVEQTARIEPSHTRADLHPDTRNTKEPLYTLLRTMEPQYAAPRCTRHSAIALTSPLH